MSGIEKGITLTELITAAQKEDWDRVDSNIPFICDNASVVEWSLGDGLGSQDENLRDLAVSVIEKSNCELRPEDVRRLTRVASVDENEHVRNRAVFALFTHGDRSILVIDGLKKACSDPEIGDIAKEYLGSLTGVL